MPQAIHSFSKEEIMAYLDGELRAERSVAAAQHLEACEECQKVASELQGISAKMADWRVEGSSASAPEVSAQKRSSKVAIWRRPLVLAAAAAMVLLSIVVSKRAASVNEFHEVFMPSVAVRATPEALSITRMTGDSLSTESRSAPKRQVTGTLAGLERDKATSGGGGGEQKEQAPLIVRTAQLNITSKSFEQVRTDVERITKVHQGYIGQLQLNTTIGENKSLTASLHIPAAELDSAIADLKRMGHINSESQNGEDVTQRYVDLEARLTNLRTTEQRLQQLLKDHAGKLSDVLEVEQAVDNTRGEIDTAVAEQKSLSNQISFARVELTISEEYSAHLEGQSPSIPTRFRNAAITGFKNALEDAIGIVAFVLSITPTLVILVVIGFLPALWLWRKRSYIFRRRVDKPSDIRVILNS